MSDGELLVFEYSGLAKRTDELHAALEGDDSLRERFAADPVGVISEQVLDAPVAGSETDVHRANRFLYSVLSNPAFLEWAESWQDRHVEDARVKVLEGEERLEVTVDREQVLRDLADALWQHGDREMLNALIAPELELSNTDLRTMDALDADAAPGVVTEGSDMAFRMPKPVASPTQIHHVITVTVVVVLAIVVAIPIPVAVPARAPQPEDAVTREDLQRLSASLFDQLKKRGEELRESGKLGPDAAM